MDETALIAMGPKPETDMENKKKMAAALAAVTMYIKTEEEAMLAIPARDDSFRPTTLPITLWGMNGRQTMMQNRNLMQMKVFHRSMPR